MVTHLVDCLNVSTIKVLITTANSLGAPSLFDLRFTCFQKLPPIPAAFSRKIRYRFREIKEHLW